MSSVVGRESEIAVVEAFLAESDRGARALAILGEPGIGKTTLWDEAVRQARDRGALVLEARPAESEARLSFSGLTDLLSPVAPERVAVLPGPQRRALDVALLRVEADRPPERRLVGTALLSLIRALAADREVVLAIDDVQWLDPPSAGATEFAIRRLKDEPVRAILSLRSGSADLLDHIVRGEGPRRLELGPLSVAALHRVVGERLKRTFPRPTLVRIAQASAGNPLHALEIARLLARADVQGSPGLPVPDSLQTLVADRVRSLPARTRDALLRASALARPDLSLVDAPALAAAEEAGLVRIGLRPADRVRAPSLRFRGVLVGATRPPPGDPPCACRGSPRPRGDRAPSRPGLRRPGRRGCRHRPGCGSPGQPGRTRHGGRADRPRSRPSSRGSSSVNELRLELARTCTTPATSNAPPRCSRS